MRTIFCNSFLFSRSTLTDVSTLRCFSKELVDWLSFSKGETKEKMNRDSWLQTKDK